MAILKMVPGQHINFTVENVEHVQGNFGPQYKFSGTTPDDATATIFLNTQTAERQLARIGLDTSSVVGRMVEFARTEKNGTKYTDINLPSGNGRAAAPAPTKQAFTSGPAIPGMDDLPYAPSETGAPPVATKLDALFQLYGAIEDHILATSPVKFARAGVGASPESTAAQIATLFITARDAGLAR